MTPEGRGAGQGPVSYFCEVDSYGTKRHHLICSRTGATASETSLYRAVETLGIRIRHIDDKRTAEDRQTALEVARYAKEAT